MGDRWVAFVGNQAANAQFGSKDVAGVGPEKISAKVTAADYDASKLYVAEESKFTMGNSGFCIRCC